MTDRNDHTSDYLGYAGDLRRALSRPALDWFRPSADGSGVAPVEARVAAYNVAVALGFCWLFDIELPNELDVVLPGTVAVEAAELLQKNLREWTEDAERLPDTFKDAGSEYEANDLVLGLLALRMRAWACHAAIEEVVLALAKEAPAKDRVKGAVDGLVDAFEHFDATLRRHRELLAEEAGKTYLLQNWRSQLADSFRANLPWWLDGTLEREVIPAEPEPKESIAGQIKLAWEWISGHLAIGAEPKPAWSFDTAQPQKAALPRTTHITSATGAILVASVFRPAGKPLTIEFRSTDLQQLREHSIELEIRQGAKVFHCTLPLQPDPKDAQVLSTRREIEGVVDPSTEYDIHFRLVGSTPSRPTGEEAS